MQNLKMFSTAFIAGIILMACSGSAGDKTQTSATDGGGLSIGSGKDMYYEYILTGGSSRMTMKTDTKMYISSTGSMRVEMTVENSAMKGKNPAPMVIIGHSDKPDESISIDDEAKTYSVNHFSDSDFLRAKKVTSTATKIGEEKILGFNSVHARIVSNITIGGSYSDVDTLDLWRSSEVPLPASVAALMDKFNSKLGMAVYSPDISNQLDQMGCRGFMTKLEIRSKGSSISEVLVKAEHRDFPASMFQVPSNYKETHD